MSYLDVSPMMNALRVSPEQFEMTEGWLRHRSSWHSFRFGPNDDVEIRAACDCAMLAIRPEQRSALASSFRQWESAYWRPMQINREFASHFERRPGVVSRLIVWTARLHRWLLERERRQVTAEPAIRTS